MPPTGPNRRKPKAPAKPKPTGGGHSGGGGSGGLTAAQFAEEVLRQIGAPVNNATVSAFVSWEAAEGGNWNNDARYNPLNTTEPMPGAGNTGSQGDIKVYTSWAQGVEATVRTLQNGNYGNIVHALKSGSVGNFGQVVAASPWGTGAFPVSNNAPRVYGIQASGGGGGGGAGVPADFSTAKSLTVGQYLDDPNIANTYGYLEAYLHNPEVGPILARAAKNGWGQDELLGALEKTHWWKTTSDSARSWQAQQRLDPATAHQRLSQMRQQIQQLSISTLGERLDSGRVNNMANAALASNWSTAQLQAAVGAEFKYQGQNAKYQGAAGQTVTGLQALSSQYLVPISNHTMKLWTRQVLEGSSTVDDFKSYLQGQAESLYPTLTAALKSGQTVQQFADPYVQLASQILEKPAGSFDLFNPKWNKVLNTVQPDGQRAPMSLSDAATYFRSLPEFQKTAGARSSAADFALNLGNIFGKISTPSAPGLSTGTGG